MTTPPVNIDELNQIMDNDIELIEECFADFLMDYPGLLSDLKLAVKQLNFQTMDDTAHKLKGIFKYLAAESAATAAFELERAGRNQDSENLDEKLSNLESHAQKVILYIDQFPS